MGYQSIYCRFVKPALDWLCAFLGLLLFWWLLAIIAIAIKLDDPAGPVLFRQDRIGKDGKVYKIYKFRSMQVGAEHTGSGVYSDDRDSRVTKTGKIIRRTSLDELPQLFNVLKLDCSLVGFRSPLTYHPWPWEEYTDEQKKMFRTRPGITGWAQVNGRKTVEWHRRIELNVWYSEHVSLWLDLKILFMTVFKVLRNADNENIEETVKTESVAK